MSIQINLTGENLSPSNKFLQDNRQTFIPSIIDQPNSMNDADLRGDNERPSQVRRSKL